MRPILCLFLVASLHAAQQPNDCYFTVTPSAFRLGNSHLEITLNPANGAITGLFNKRTGRALATPASPEIFRLTYAADLWDGLPKQNPWHAVGGTLVTATRQRISSHQFRKTDAGGVLELTYAPLRLERRSVDVFLRLTVELDSRSSHTLWRASIRNESPGVVTELQYPFIAGLAPLSALLMPNQSGERLRNPVAALSDETPLIQLEYPARASMQWFDYSGAGRGLYLASYDQSLAFTRLNFGRAPLTGSTAMWLSKFPFVASGSDWSSPPLALGVHDGDWHWSADRYREWIESWIPKPHVAASVHHMVGGMREIAIMNQAEKRLHTYEEIVPFARETLLSRAQAVFMIVGWFPYGHDTLFPEYRPIEELGGASALRAALDQVHSLGLGATAYLNARLCNHETDTYRRAGRTWAVLGKAPGLGVSTIDTFELQETWNTEWSRFSRGEGRFAVMCPSAKGWQDHIVGQIEGAVRDYGFDGLFLDQPGSYFAQLCYSPFHGHSSPATAWGPGYLEIFRRARERTRAVHPQSVLWTEGMNDALNQFLDYTMDKSLVWSPMRSHPSVESCVEMWRYTLPWYVTANYSGYYSLPESKDPVHGDGYRFVHGIRGINKGSSGRVKVNESQAAPRSAYVDRIATLWQQAAEYFFDGTYLDTVGLSVSDPRIHAAVYRASSNSDHAIAIWNSSDKTISTDFTVTPSAWKASTGQTARFLDNRNKVSLEPVSSLSRRFRLSLAPHALEVIVLSPASLTKQPG